jgi:hypothetical protein
MKRIRLGAPITLRVSNYALVVRRGIFDAGWSRVFWRLWRYSEQQERIWLQLHADVYGLGLLPGEPITKLRGRIEEHVKAIGVGEEKVRGA